MPGIGISIVLFAVGAILDFAVTVGPNQHGFNIHNAGVILMIVGAIAFVASLLVHGFGDTGWSGTRRHQTTIDDGQGNVMRREDVSK
jgi:membrane-bound ClpP family serine protease